MKIVATNLKKYIKKSGLTVAEVVRRMNIMRDTLTPGRRKMTENTIYTYYYGHTPKKDKIYILSGILGVKPQKLFGLIFDEDLRLECTRLASTIGTVKIKKVISPTKAEITFENPSTV